MTTRFDVGDTVFVHEHWREQVRGREFVVKAIDETRLVVEVAYEEGDVSDETLSFDDVTSVRPLPRDPLADYLAVLRRNHRLSGERRPLQVWALERLRLLDFDAYHPRLSRSSAAATEFRTLEERQWEACVLGLRAREDALRRAFASRSPDEQVATWKASWNTWVLDGLPTAGERELLSEAIGDRDKLMAVLTLCERLQDKDWSFARDAASALKMPDAIEDEAYEAWRASRGEPTFDEVCARANVAIERAFERYPAVKEHVARVYGLSLPKQVAIARAFFDVAGKLRTHVPEFGEVDMLRWNRGISERYLLDLFEDGALERAVIPRGDERLADRSYRDPPEMVTVMSGGTDGLHWGLWYDDPRFDPSFVVSNFANDDPVISVGAGSILDEIRNHLCWDEEAGLQREARFECRLLREYLWAFAEANARAVAEEVRCPFARTKTLDGGPGIAAPHSLLEELPDELTEGGHLDEERIEPLLQKARTGLAAGRPLTALALARVLHYLNYDGHRADVDALFDQAYRALSRDALAEIANAHRRGRDESNPAEIFV